MDGAWADLAVFILAGGKSQRMGTDKAFVPFNGRTLLSRALDLARSVSSDIYIVGDARKFSTFGRVIEDVFPNCGPLGGIQAALLHSEKSLNLMLAVDMPFVSFALLQFLISRARNSEAVVTVAHAGNHWQPLCAVYRKEFAGIAEEALHAGRYKIDALFDHVKVESISEDELEVAGFAAAIFRNLNSPTDLVEANTVDANGNTFSRGSEGKLRKAGN